MDNKLFLKTLVYLTVFPSINFQTACLSEKVVTRKKCIIILEDERDSLCPIFDLDG